MLASRIWAGLHYRNSNNVAIRMGEQTGALVAATCWLP
jgi:hypothetical protein